MCHQIIWQLNYTFECPSYKTVMNCIKRNIFVAILYISVSICKKWIKVEYVIVANRVDWEMKTLIGKISSAKENIIMLII